MAEAGARAHRHHCRAVRLDLYPDDLPTAGARYTLWFSYSSIPFENTLVDAERIAIDVAKRLDGVVYDPQCDELIPLDHEPQDFRPGLRGLWDFWREIQRARRLA